MLAALLLLAAPPQADERPTTTIDRLDVSRSSSFPYIELDISTTYPPRSMLTFETAPGYYVFHFYDDRFEWSPTEDFSRNSTSIEVPQDGVRRNIKLPLPSPGIHDLRVRFVLNRQAFPDRVRPKLGPYWFEAVLDQRTVAVGMDETVTRDLAADARECRRLVERAARAVGKIAEFADAGEGEWEPKILAEMEDLTKVHEDVMSRRPATMLQGTYELVDQVVGNVLMSEELIKAYYYERKKREKQGKPLDGLSIESYSMGGDLDEVTHPPDPEEQGPPADKTRRGRISYARMVKQLEKCREVYRRESTIWTLRFIDLLRVDLAALESRVRGGAPFAGETEAVTEATRSMSRIRELVATLPKEDDYRAVWRLDDEKDNFPADADLLLAYQAALMDDLAGEKVAAEAPESLAAQKRDLDAKLKEWADRMTGAAPK